MMDMPALKQVVSQNYSPTPINHNLVVIHRTEGGYAGSVAWLCDRRANASAHLVMKLDGSEVTQLVPLRLKAWAQVAFNSEGVSLEIEGYSAQGMTVVTMQAAARIVAWLCRTYAIPPVWAPNGVGRGICQHHDLGAAGGGHVDCFGVDSDDWRTFLGYVKDAYGAFGDGPLPAWALHGLPAPHSVELPPDVDPAASHGGAARNEPGDVVAHPTASGFPHGSVSDLQWRLNNAGASPALSIDGDAGNQTRAALIRFQKAYGLVVDGQLGPKTWAALDKATSHE